MSAQPEQEQGDDPRSHHPPEPEKRAAAQAHPDPDADDKIENDDLPAYGQQDCAQALGIHGLVAAIFISLNEVTHNLLDAPWRNNTRQHPHSSTPATAPALRCAASRSASWQFRRRCPAELRCSWSSAARRVVPVSAGLLRALPGLLPAPACAVACFWPA